MRLLLAEDEMEMASVLILALRNHDLIVAALIHRRAFAHYAIRHHIRFELGGSHTSI